MLGLGALIPILFSLGGNLPGYHFIWRARPRATKHAGAGADDADRLPRARGARRRRRLEAPLAGSRRRSWPCSCSSTCGWRSSTRPPPIPHNPVYAALRQQSPGRLLELPVFDAGSQSASVYLYYLMQAPHQHPSGYSTTAPLAADRRLRELQKTPCRYLRPLGVRELVTHYDAKNPCGGRLIARAGRIAAYRVR